MANERLICRECAARLDGLVRDFDYATNSLQSMVDGLKDGVVQYVDNPNGLMRYHSAYVDAFAMQCQVFELLVQRLETAAADIKELLNE